MVIFFTTSICLQSSSVKYLLMMYVKKLQFIVELHYKVTAAIHSRHKRNRLAGIEVLLIVLGKRAAVSSTSRQVCTEKHVKLFNLDQ